MKIPGMMPISASCDRQKELSVPVHAVTALQRKVHAQTAGHTEEVKSICQIDK